MGFLSKIRGKAKRMAAQQQPMGMSRSGLLRGKFFGPPQKDLTRNVDYPQGKRPSSPPPRPNFEELLASRPGLKPVEKQGNIGGNLGSDFRMPQKSGGAFGGAFRKLQEQLKNQQMSNQGIPSLPQNLDFLSRLPPNIMPEVDFSNLPQMAGNPNIPAPDGYELRENEKGMNYFRELLSPEDQAQNMIPRGIDIPFQDFNLKNMRPGFVNGRDVNIDDGGMVDFLNSDPQQKLFGIETRIGMLQNQLKEAEANRDRESFDMIVQEINNADAQRIEIMNSMKPNPINQDFQQRGFDKAFRALLKGGVKGRDDSEIAEQQKLQNLEMQIGQQQAIDDLLSSLEKKN